MVRSWTYSIKKDLGEQEEEEEFIEGKHLRGFFRSFFICRKEKEV